MNIIGLLAGELVETATKVAINKFSEKYKAKETGNYSHWLASATSKFDEILNSKIQAGSDLNINDLELDPEQVNNVLELRELAINKGLKTFEAEINGTKFKVNTVSLDITPIV